MSPLEFDGPNDHWCVSSIDMVSMLFELDTNIQKIRAAYGESEATVGITGHYHNLLRMWAEM